MISWVFLDVGNILLDEDPLTFHVFRRHAAAIQSANPGFTFSDVLSERQALASGGTRWPLYALASRYLDATTLNRIWNDVRRETLADYAAFCPPIPGAEELIERLARRFRLGLIANQPAECRAVLDRLGWLDRFAVVALSEERSLFKPDPALFRWAIARAGVEPSSCLMIGDRRDNDIAPASDVGMKTVWVRWPERESKGWRPDDPAALAYRASLERIETARAGSAEAVRPWKVVDTIAEIDEKIAN